MKTFEHKALLGRLFPSIFILLLSGCAIIGTYETVTIHAEHEDRVVDVKIDSGARRTSIDISLARELGLRETDEIQTVTSASGVTQRQVVEIEYTLAGETIKTTANVADRSQLQYQMIVGVRDLDGRFLIRPERMLDEEEAEEN